MRAVRPALLLLVLALLTEAALAHPFGNLAIDATSQLTISPDKLILRYLLFLPEASAYGQLQLIDSNHDGQYTDAEKQAYMGQAAPKVLQSIEASLNDKPLQLHGVNAKAVVEAGVGGLSTLRITYVFEAPLPADALLPEENTLHFKDDNFTGTPGWKEIDAAGQGEIRIVKAPPRPEAAIDALETDAAIVFLPHGGSNTAATPPPALPRPRSEAAGRLAGLIASKEIDFKLLLVALAIAFGLGALHALTPGHGKTIVGAYLVGSRGTIPQAMFLGTVVTFTHTISVIILGLICLFAFQYAVPERMYPWLGFASGLLIAIMGAWLLLARRTDPVAHDPHDHHHHNHDHDHDHQHDHDHHHDHDHSHHHHDHHHDHHRGQHHHAGAQVRAKLEGIARLQDQDPDRHVLDAKGGHTHGGKYHTHSVPDRVNFFSLLALGISGGIVPCPDALVVLLSAVALHKIALGLLVIVAFSCGLAAVLIAIGIAMVTAGKMLDRFYPKKAFLNRITSLTYIFIFFVGLTIAVQSLMAAGIITVHLNG